MKIIQDHQNREPFPVVHEIAPYLLISSSDVQRQIVNYIGREEPAATGRCKSPNKPNIPHKLGRLIVRPRSVSTPSLSDRHFGDQDCYIVI